MKIFRFAQGDGYRYGISEGDAVRAVEGDPYSGFRPTGTLLPLAGLDLLAPCVPGKAVCIGLNYRDHAREIGASIPAEPVVFLKPPTSVAGPGQPILYPGLSTRVDFEGELAVVIGKRASAVGPEDAMARVLGYTCANDVTARDLQRLDGQWTICKGFDTFLPLGPCIATDIDPGKLGIRTLVDGEVRQDSSTLNMIFDVRFLVSWLSFRMTLEPGDVIVTGTPPGIGPMRRGQTVTVEIEGIGSLSNRVE